MKQEINEIKKQRKISRMVMGLVYILLVYLTYHMYETGQTRNTQSIMNFEDYIGGIIILLIYPFGVMYYERYIGKQIKKKANKE